MKNSLRIAKILLVAMVCAGLEPVLTGNRVAAQGKGQIKGVIKDEKGKPIKYSVITKPGYKAPRAVE